MRPPDEFVVVPTLVSVEPESICRVCVPAPPPICRLLISRDPVGTSTVYVSGSSMQTIEDPSGTPADQFPEVSQEPPAAFVQDVVHAAAALAPRVDVAERAPGANAPNSAPTMTNS